MVLPKVQWSLEQMRRVCWLCESVESLLCDRLYPRLNPSVMAGPQAVWGGAAAQKLGKPTTIFDIGIATLL